MLSHFELNRELLERHGITELTEENFDQIAGIVHSCAMTKAEILGVCEIKSSFENIEEIDTYNSSEASKQVFADVLKEQVINAYLVGVDEKVSSHESSLQSMYASIKRDLIDVLKSDLDSLELKSFELDANEKLIRNIISKVMETTAIFSTDSKDIQKFTQQEQDEILQTYFTFCGDEATSDNAVAFTVRQKPFILVCPNNFLHLLGDTEQLTNELYAATYFTIVHEVAHQLLISMPVEKTIPMEHVSNLVKCMSNEYSGNEGINSNPENYTDEVLADYYANRAFGQLFKTETFKGMSVQEKISILQNHLGDCVEHTMMDLTRCRFRISQMLYRTPEVFNELNCYKHVGQVVTSCNMDELKVLNLGF